MSSSKPRHSADSVVWQDRAAEAVDRHVEDYLQLLAELVRCPTTLGNERPAQELVYRRLQSLGLQAEMWELDPGELASQPTFAPVDWDYAGRPNVRAVLSPASSGGTSREKMGIVPSVAQRTSVRGEESPAARSGLSPIFSVGNGGKSLVLNGHIDVVSPEPVDWWTYDPWGATVTNGRMYGRGALDMKAGLVAELLAIRAVIDVGAELRGPVIFESVIEEECTGNGMLAARLRSGPVDAAIVTELTGFEAWTATPGVVWFEVVVRGRPAYVGQAGQYVNAIETATALISRMKPPMVAELNAAFDHPAFAGQSEPLVLSVGKISGGDWPSNVPLECRFTCRMSFPIGWSFEQVQMFVERHIATAASENPWLADNPPSVHYPGFRALGWAAEESRGETDSSLIETLTRCHQATVGKPLERRGFPGTADARYFDAAGGEQALYYGPSGANIHAPDEYVELESVAQVARVLARLIIAWCG